MFLTVRDREMLQWINGHGFVTADQAALWMGVCHRVGRRRLQRLVERGYCHRCHVVWATKYRYDVLRGELHLWIREMIRQFCHELNVEIVKGALSTDHVHMLISVSPKVSISQVIQRMKGRSSYRVQQEFLAIRKRYWGRHFWAKGYFSTTSGNITEDVILQNLENHITDPTDASR